MLFLHHIGHFFGLVRVAERAGAYNYTRLKMFDFTAITKTMAEA